MDKQIMMSISAAVNYNSHMDKSPKYGGIKRSGQKRIHSAGFHL